MIPPRTLHPLAPASGRVCADVPDVDFASSWINPPVDTERGAALLPRLDAALNRLDFYASDVG